MEKQEIRASSHSVQSAQNDTSWVLVAVVGTAFALLITYGFLQVTQPQPLRAGPAPAFTLTLFNGEQLTLEELRGRPVVVHFWASWCLPCQAEAPTIAKVWADYRDRGVSFVGIAYHDTEPRARAFITEFGLLYPNGLDGRGEIARAYGISGVPETFFIRPDGNIAAVHLGLMSEKELRAALDDLLNQA